MNVRMNGFGAIGHRLSDFLFTHNRMIFAVLFLVALIGALLGLNLALTRASDEVYRGERESAVQSPRFDQTTIDRINLLNAKQQTVTDMFPSGRISPFDETR
ncbi:MAG TPA: hypothetical protein VF597_03770 [Candidatus Saccharimonadales bacterium]|jgi:glyceraldehyde-3-phosphate dehydrogenase/erythrose-4-phosphate dehydrogenase